MAKESQRCGCGSSASLIVAPVEPVEDERLVAMDDEAADVEDGAGRVMG